MAPIEDLWDVLWEIHLRVGTNGRTAMLYEGNLKYGNITRPIIELFLRYSEQYKIKQKKKKNHGLVTKPIRSENFMSRWQIDLIDFRTLKDGEYEWILTVQDHFTKFVWLRN